MSRMIIVGSGVVGQATGKGFTKKGHTVSYVDINPQTIAKLRGNGLNAMMAAEVDWNTVDVVLLAVSTPSVNDKIVLDYIEAAALDVGVAWPLPTTMLRLWCGAPCRRRLPSSGSRRFWSTPRAKRPAYTSASR